MAPSHSIIGSETRAALPTGFRVGSGHTSATTTSQEHGKGRNEDGEEGANDGNERQGRKVEVQ